MLLKLVDFVNSRLLFWNVNRTFLKLPGFSSKIICCYLFQRRQCTGSGCSRCSDTLTSFFIKKIKSKLNKTGYKFKENESHVARCYFMLNYKLLSRISCIFFKNLISWNLQATFIKYSAYLHITFSSLYGNLWLLGNYKLLFSNPQTRFLDDTGCISETYRLLSQNILLLILLLGLGRFII